VVDLPLRLLLKIGQWTIPLALLTWKGDHMAEILYRCDFYYISCNHSLPCIILLIDAVTSSGIGKKQGYGRKVQVAD